MSASYYHVLLGQPLRLPAEAALSLKLSTFSSGKRIFLDKKRQDFRDFMVSLHFANDELPRPSQCFGYFITQRKKI